MTLPASAADRRAAAPCWAPLLLGVRRPPLSIDISCPHSARQRTCRTPLLRSNDGTDKRTDRRPPDRFIDPAPPTMRALSARQQSVADSAWALQPLHDAVVVLAPAVVDETQPITPQHGCHDVYSDITLTVSAADDDSEQVTIEHGGVCSKHQLIGRYRRIDR